MSPGSHIILMLLWVQKKITKYMGRVHADGAEKSLVPFTVLTEF